ncbi:uncharacterized protein B0H64DRAFT_374688 [Chaetomium fimeti]|uniref:Uncharacterized protein n=1 Tax=Chaetomium fimeti TaxID=1854472 RepID=A0AAE0HCM8_9PEZI|nr:hypothetical protein B0H64DRAFT_374688 [Chaetomium fimeti]
MATLQNPFGDSPSRMDVGDEPLPPPAHVADAIPDFHTHGEQRCGNHRHDLKSKNFEKYLQRYGETEPATWKVPCSNCHHRVKLNQVHDLPCGEIICRNCLMVRAFNVKLNIEKHREEIEVERNARWRINMRFRRNPNMTANQRKAVVQKNAAIRRNMLHLAGLMCCGVDMQLGRFISCMAPKISRNLWLAIDLPPLALRNLPRELDGGFDEQVSGRSDPVPILA